MQTPLTQSKFYNDIRDKITKINKERRSALRILSTPNNDDSSRGYLQITINLKFTEKANKTNKTSKLVFFDMPGSENTVRITQEFLGVETFSDIEDLNDEFGKINKKTFEFDKISTMKSNDKLTHTDIFLIPSPTASSVTPIDLPNFITKIKKHSTTDRTTDRTTERTTPPQYSIYISSNILCESLLTKKNKIEKTELLYFVNNVDNTLIIDKKTILVNMFKEFIISTTDYKAYSSTTGLFFMEQENIASCTEKLTLFFNKETCESIFDVEREKKIVFLNETHFKSIVKQFLKTVIFQPSTSDKKDGDTTLYFKYFRLINVKSEDKIEPIEDDDYKYRFGQITRIYDITYPNKKKYLSHQKLYAYFKGYHLKLLLEDILIEDKGLYKFEDNANQDTNVMILLFMYLLNNVLSTNVTHENYKSQKTEDTKNMWNILIIYVYKYVKFIIDQGTAIITTLEHLKYFFLSNINKIEEYNKNKNTAMTLYTTDTGNINTNTSILTTERIYTTPTKIKVKKTQPGGATSTDIIILNERVNCGNMISYRLLSILQKLKNATTDLEQYKYKINTIETFNLQQEYNKTPDQQSPALFIMLAHIKCFGDDTNINDLKINDTTLDNTLQKICTAEYDTLYFAQSISSTSQSLQSSQAVAVASHPAVAFPNQQSLHPVAVASHSADAPLKSSHSAAAAPHPVASQQISGTFRNTQSLPLKSALPGTAPIQIGNKPNSTGRTYGSERDMRSTGAKPRRGGSITNSNSQHKTKKNIKKFDFNTLYKTKNKDNKHKSFTIKKKYNNVNQSIFKIKSKKQ